MRMKKVLAVLLASTTVFSTTAGNVWAAEEVEVESVLEDNEEFSSEEEKTEFDAEESSSEGKSIDTESNIFSEDDFSDGMELIDSYNEDTTDVAGTSNKSIIAQGIDSWDNIPWKLYSDGELVFDGLGEIKDYTETNLPAWHEYRDKITKVELKNNITTIGAHMLFMT